MKWESWEYNQEYKGNAALLAGEDETLIGLFSGTDQTPVWEQQNGSQITQKTKGQKNMAL